MADGSLRDRILAADDMPFEDVELPEWGETVRVRGLSSRERDTFEDEILDDEGVADVENIRARLLVRTCLDPETGKRVFTDDDADALGAKSAKPMQRLFSVARRLSALSEDDIEELVKNSESAPTDSSDSP